MTRNEAYLHILEAAAEFQRNISIMLEAKAVEAEKSKNWILNHLFAENFSNHSQQVDHSMELNENLIQVIDGITKMENSLARNLKVILNKEESERFDFPQMGSDFMNFGNES